MTTPTPQLRKSIPPIQDQHVRDEVISPNKSFIVQAPAGSGKTTLLVSRYLELLSHVQQPEEILAITFTRKAAREMKTRILTELEQLQTDQAKRVRERSEKMHWELDLNPQRLKIQTIDAFAYSLVQRMPVESQLSLDTKQMDSAQQVYDSASAKLLGLIFSDDPFADDIAQTLGLLDNDYSYAVSTFSDMAKKRAQWIDPVRSIIEELTQADGSERLKSRIIQTRKKFLDSVIDREVSKIPLPVLILYSFVGLAIAENLNDDYDEGVDTPADWRYLCKIFLTTTGSRRKTINKTLGAPSESVARHLWLAAASLSDDFGFNPEEIKDLQFLPDYEPPESHLELIESLVSVLVRLNEQLNEEFRERESIDFTELSFAAQRALSVEETPTELAQILDYRISHVLIDEFQDTSQAQFDLLERVMSSWSPDSGNTFFAVGDPMQSIYRFRNADLSLFQYTYKYGLNNVIVEPRQLTSNFRSSSDVVERNNDLFEKVFGALEDPTEGAIVYAPSVPIQSFEGSVNLTLCTKDTDGLLEAQQVAKRIAELSASGENESIGMLVRSRNNLPVYFDALRNEGLKWRGVEITPLKKSPVVRDLFTLVQAWNDERDRTAWLAFFRSPLCGLSLPDLEILSQYSTGWEMLRCDNQELKGKQRLKRARTCFERATEDRHLTLRSQIERLWFRLGGNDVYEASDSEESLVNAERFLEFLEATTRGEIRMDELWERIESEYATEESRNAVVEIMTIHKAKGLEFDHIILPDLNRGTRPDTAGIIEWQRHQNELLVALKPKEGETDPLFTWLVTKAKDKDRNERKRLLYVAMTRARKSVSLFAGFKADQIKPRDQTLLSLLIYFFPIDDQKMVVEEREDEEDKGNEEKSKSEPRGKIQRNQELSRLVSHYAFNPPESSHALPQSLQDTPSQYGKTSPPVGYQLELALGNLVHRELQRIAEIQDFDQAGLSSERIENWRNYLRAEGVDGSNLARILELAQRQVKNVLADPKGRWMLDSEHEFSESEAPYSAIIYGKLRNVVIDRTFVDSDDVRWIIDFKTTMVGFQQQEEIEQFVHTQYSRQMELYSSVLHAFDGRKSKCAIYLTDIPQLIELDVSHGQRV